MGDVATQLVINQPRDLAAAPSRTRVLLACVQVRRGDMHARKLLALQTEQPHTRLQKAGFGLHVR